MIVREGWPFIGIALAITLLFLWLALNRNSLGWLIGAVVMAALTLFVTFFFRNPDRVIPSIPLALVAPADGRITAITELESHPHIGGPATRVSIFLSVFDVHVNRTPAAGTIDYVVYHSGKFLAAFEDKASELNERTEIGMTTIDGRKIAFAQIAGVIARRIVCRLESGDEVDAGDRFGLIRFGSRTDLIVPHGTDIKVKLGDRVLGGESIMAQLAPSGVEADQPRMEE